MAKRRDCELGARAIEINQSIMQKRESGEKSQRLGEPLRRQCTAVSVYGRDIGGKEQYNG